MCNNMDGLWGYYARKWNQWHIKRQILSDITYVCVCVCELFSHVWLFATLWTVAHQDPLSMGLSRLEYQSGLPSFLQGSSWPRDWTLVSGMWNLKNATN